VMTVVLLLATPAGAVAGAVTRGAHRAHASFMDRVFAPNRVVTNRHLAGLAAVLVVALVLVARRRVLFE
jgi:hypothetical protein